jgi:hypothetical protein
MTNSFTGYVFLQDGLALALDKEQRPVRVEPAPDSFLPDGFSVCRIDPNAVTSQGVAPAEYMASPGGPTNIGRLERLKTEWEKAYIPFKWNRDALRQPFLSLDIESDGAKIWEVALIPADGADPYVASGQAVSLKELQSNLSRLLEGRILVGHNVRRWDMTVLARHGIHFPRQPTIWDTLEWEPELCQERARPSYALRTEHRAELDAHRVLDLARNQWLRRHAHAVPEIVEAAWRESDKYFLVPAPEWAELSSGLEWPRSTWESIEASYGALAGARLDQKIKQAEWWAFSPPPGEAANSPFNPASPKRVDYWHRLMPAIESARRGGRAAVLFVQHEAEVEKLVHLIDGAFTGDTRRGGRRLEREGGLLVLSDATWGRTLSEGLPNKTNVILEKMPEAVSSDRGNQEAVDLGKMDHASNEQSTGAEGGEEQDVEASDTAESQIELPETRMRRTQRPLPDLRELGKMALWRRPADPPRFFCLDARLWNQRGAAPYRVRQAAWDPGESVPRSRVEDAGFRQTTGEFHLQDAWEDEICDWFGVGALHAFQRSKLARILPRDGLSFEYVERATGGGKSLIFQAAALHRGAATGRLTVVISPLRALIHDQVSKLHAGGFALDVEALSGDMSRPDIEEAYRRIAGGETIMVYTAPERFRSKGFLRALETRISLDAGGQPEYWVFDEAHCISLWGLEFRPDYRKAAAYIRERRGNAADSAAPVLLVSATLTKLAKDDIERVLGLDK